MTNGLLSESREEGLRKRLDEAVVLLSVVEQLRKDLNAPGLVLPTVGPTAFESLRAQVLEVLGERERQGGHALGLVLNRVDLTEGAFQQAVRAGGPDQLAAVIVLRCLQKVLARERYAGRG